MGSFVGQSFMIFFCRHGAGSVRSGGSHGVKGSATRSQSRRGGGSVASTSGTKRGEQKAESVRPRSDRTTSDRRHDEAASMGMAVQGRRDGADVRGSAHDVPRSLDAAVSTQVKQQDPPPARKKRVPPSLSGNKARNRSEKESDVVNGVKMASSSKSSTPQNPSISEVDTNATHHSSLKPSTAAPAAEHANDGEQPATVAAALGARLNANAAEFHPSSSTTPPQQELQGRERGTVAEAAPNEHTLDGSVNTEAACDTAKQDTAQTMPSTSSPVISDQLAARPSGSQLENLKFNVDAPEFHPASAGATTASTKLGSEVDAGMDVHVPARPSSDHAVEPETGSVTEAATSHDVPDSAAGPAEVSMRSEAVANGQGGDDEDDDVEFVHRNVVLVGKDIGAEAEETADEKLAAQRLVEIAKDLQRMGELHTGEPA